MHRRWQTWLHLLMGFWLLISPLLLAFPTGYGSAAAVNVYVSGAILIAINLQGISRPAPWQEWVSLLIGVWLLLSTFVLGISEQRLVMWNNLIAGIVILIGAILALNWMRARPEQ